jgi:hypothetical protein
VCGAAKEVRLFEHRVEHRREVARRRVDHLQYVGGCGLLLQGLARLSQKPRILHRDDRLRREILQQRKLLIGERTNFLSKHDDCAQQNAVLAQCRGNDGARAGEIDNGAAVRIDPCRLICSDVPPAKAVVTTHANFTAGSSAMLRSRAPGPRSTTFDEFCTPVVGESVEPAIPAVPENCQPPS